MMEGLGLQASMGLNLGVPHDQELSLKWVQSILGAHKDKQFVQRLLNPSVYPNIPMGDSAVGTHYMGWATVGKDNTPIVYPSIIQDKAGKMHLLSDDAAFDYAMKTGEYIPFDTPQNADLFTRSYKRILDR